MSHYVLLVLQVTLIGVAIRALIYVYNRYVLYRPLERALTAHQ